MEKRQPAYWSYTPDQRFVPVNAAKTAAHNPVLPPPYTNPAYRVCPSVLPPPPRLAPRPAARSAAVVSTSTAATWSMADRDAKRKKRMAAYRVYSVESQVKSSLRNSFRWVKNKIVRQH